MIGDVKTGQPNARIISTTLKTEAGFKAASRIKRKRHNRVRSSLYGRSGAARMRFSKTVSESSSALTRWSSSPILSAPTLTVPSDRTLHAADQIDKRKFPCPIRPLEPYACRPDDLDAQWLIPERALGVRPFVIDFDEFDHPLVQRGLSTIQGQPRFDALSANPFAPLRPLA